MSYAEAADTTSRFRRVLREGHHEGRLRRRAQPQFPRGLDGQAAICLSGAIYTGLHPLGSVDDHVDLCRTPRSRYHRPSQVRRNRRAYRRRATNVKHLLTLGPADVGEDLLALCTQVGPETLSRGGAEEEDIAWLQYTGGTTGRPKAAMISHRAMVQQVCRSPPRGGCRGPADPHRNSDYPRRGPTVLPTLLRGGTVVLQAGFDPEHGSPRCKPIASTTCSRSPPCCTRCSTTVV